MARRKTTVQCEHLKVEQWFERDRQHVSVETPSGHTLVEWWDDAVTEMVDDGFFRTGRTRGMGRPGAPIDPKSVIDYVRENGMCTGSSSLRGGFGRSRKRGKHGCGCGG